MALSVTDWEHVSRPGRVVVGGEIVGIGVTMHLGSILRENRIRMFVAAHKRGIGVTSLLCGVLLCLIFIPLTVRSGEGARPQNPGHKNVLILNSYHAGYPWTDDLVSAISTGLGRDFKDLDVMVEFMDAKRFEEHGQSVLFREMLPRKYANHALDLIIATDDIALRFLIRPFGVVSRNTGCLLRS